MRCLAAWLAGSLALLALVASPSAGRDRLTENTYRLGASETSPPASIDDVAWLEGRWVGEGLGGVSEELWSGPLGGAMMGAYRLVKDGEPVFYELVTLVEENGSLVFRLKHFHPDLRGWEEREETVDFPLVALDEGAVHFEGMSLHPDGDELTIFLAIHQDDGTLREARFTYSRRPLRETRDGSPR